MSPKETNSEVIFTGPESIEESINMQEEEEDPSLISDAESAIRSSPIIEISDDASNLGVGKYPLEGSDGILARQRTMIYMMETLTIGILVTRKI